MSDIKKFNNTKWDVSEWSEEMKSAWQMKMLDLEFAWIGFESLPKVRNLDEPYYFVHDSGITYTQIRETFDGHPHTTFTWEDAFPEKKTKPSIFDNPKWVTCCDDSLGQVTLGKDYKVVSVNNDNYTIIMDTGIKVSLHKDRFHKVTYEDLLPEKVTSEEQEEGFEGLVVDYSVLNDCTYVAKSKFSEEQLNFMQKELPTYSDTTFNGNNFTPFAVFCGNTFVNIVLPHLREKELSFNNIFKHKSEI